MKILFLGGSGNISWWCVQKAINEGHDVYELNRAMTRITRRSVQQEVHELIADIRDEDAVREALGDEKFDVICDFICFNEEQAKRAIRLFAEKCDQYIVISSEAVYQRKSRYLPFRENTPQYDLTVEDSYIAGKIIVEQTFMNEYRKNGFPITIVRPGYTYDTIIQMPVGQNCFTAPRRLLEGYPFLMLGDGENLVAPMHSRDFANAFYGLIGNKETIGEDYHIAAQWLITWNEMARSILKALGLDTNSILHISYDVAVGIQDFYSKIVNEQHMWHYIFDDTKIKTIVPDWEQTISFEDGIQETVTWLLEDARRQRINDVYDKKLMRIYEKYKEGK